MEGNKSALGVDLSKIPDQAASVEYVKTKLKYNFDGPKQLVQGVGTGVYYPNAGFSRTENIGEW